MSSFTHEYKTNLNNICTLYGAFSVGASGAPTLITTNGISCGIKSITRVSTGLYDIVFGDISGTNKYQSFVSYYITYQLSSVPTVFTQQNVISYTLSSSTLRVQTTKPTASTGPVVSAAVADPDSGAIIYFEIVMKVM